VVQALPPAFISMTVHKNCFAFFEGTDFQLVVILGSICLNRVSKIHKFASPSNISP
jgi:hypothetical protein